MSDHLVESFRQTPPVLDEFSLLGLLATDGYREYAARQIIEREATTFGNDQSECQDSAMMVRPWPFLARAGSAESGVRLPGPSDRFVSGSERKDRSPEGSSNENPTLPPP